MSSQLLKVIKIKIGNIDKNEIIFVIVQLSPECSTCLMIKEGDYMASEGPVLSAEQKCSEHLGFGGFCLRFFVAKDIFFESRGNDIIKVRYF